MGFMRVAVGDRVFANGCEAVITHVVSADRVIVRDLTTGAARQLPIRDPFNWLRYLHQKSGARQTYLLSATRIGPWLRCGTRPFSRCSKPPGLTFTS
jgi:hypothetical protein